MNVVLSTKRMIRLLAGIVIGLAVLHGLSYVPMMLGLRSEPVNMINLDGEQNLSSLFSTVLLWMCSVLAWFVARALAPSSDRGRWIGLFVIFLYLGLDESLSLHERLGGFVNHGLPGVDMATFAWVLPYAVLLLFLAGFYCRLWWQLPPPVRLRVALGGALFVFGGMGCEFLGWLCTRLDGPRIFYLLEILTEELLEMAGVITLISAFLNYVGLLGPEISISIRTQPACRPEFGR